MFDRSVDRRHLHVFSNLFREAAKKVLFLVARLLRPLAPPPLGLVTIGTFFLTLKKVLFSLVAHTFSPTLATPLLVASLIQ